MAPNPVLTKSKIGRGQSTYMVIASWLVNRQANAPRSRV
jgi:hypothetical protein